MDCNIWNIILRYIVVLAFTVVDLASSLHITEFKVPSVTDVNGVVTLECQFGMGKDKLHSVKFYKDGQEFYRFVPSDPNPMKFPVPGATTFERPGIDVCNRRSCSISLGYLNASSSGLYRCEVSGDAPTFNLADKSKNMTVYALPHREPIIIGVLREYEIGDSVFANCTSDLSFPPATLSWYINDRKVTSEFLLPQRDMKVEESKGFSKYIRNLNLQFLIEKERFGDSTARIQLKCVATIPNAPSATKESTTVIYVPSLEKLRKQMPLNLTSKGIIQYQIDLCTLLLTLFIGRLSYS